MGCVYKIINIINNKIYVGKTTKTIEKRFKSHIQKAKRKTNRYLYDAMNHYGYENFKIELIEEIVDNDILNEREIYWISTLNSQDKEIGYNLTIGGDGGNTGTYYYGKSPYDWWIEKYGKEKADFFKQQAITNSSKTIIEQRKGKKSILTDEQKKKISETNIRKGIKPPVMNWYELGIKPPRLGEKQSKETKEKISKVRKGKTFEEIFKDKPETIIKMKNSLKNRWIGDKNINFKNVKGEEIMILLKLGKSRKEISKTLNISNPTIISKFKKEFGCTPSEYFK